MVRHGTGLWRNKHFHFLTRIFATLTLSTLKFFGFSGKMDTEIGENKQRNLKQKHASQIEVQMVESELILKGGIFSVLEGGENEIIFLNENLLTAGLSHQVSQKVLIAILHREEGERGGERGREREREGEKGGERGRERQREGEKGGEREGEEHIKLHRILTTSLPLAAFPGH